MKRFALLACAALFMAAGCGSDNPNGPSNQPTVFTVPLRASNEVPPITNADANATGTAVITANTTKDSNGNITAVKFDFNVTMQGFPPNTSAILAHIHNAPVNVTGGVVVNSGLSAGNAIAMPNGSGSFTVTNLDAKDLATAQDILNNPQNYYFNVHTPLNPSGAIRGQLR
jgi:CHRD domain